MIFLASFDLETFTKKGKYQTIQKSSILPKNGKILQISFNTPNLIFFKVKLSRRAHHLWLVGNQSWQPSPRHCSPPTPTTHGLAACRQTIFFKKKINTRIWLAIIRVAKLDH